MIYPMQKTATLLLKHRPTDERCLEIATDVARSIDPEASVDWALSDEIPDGYAVDLVDQLQAHRRDLDGHPVYLTVTITSRVDA